ncbi:hypothetical protein OFO01_07595 [Campylobacter sp. JMF_01 NE2]|uniref:type II toxin-antitoxin system RelE family toxin n=1 Tax=unclassified Campylobacter TaxID=2593542 RepID=UPI0022E9E3EF|nr:MULTISPECIES: hypothetical protein [unclassified Campylobacter]MDA3053334.1 hypothetical protein [Campylobacter sp. JMF_03 NE3]MDA3067646.1 hypothetical protein [Campylobacter sp. JMF_01 NE2]
MQWRIDFHKEVYKEFEKIGKVDSLFIINKLKDFEKKYSEEFERELIKVKKIKKLKTKSNIYRLRLRTFRVLYAKNNGILRLLVVRVRHRKDAYQNLETLDNIVKAFENEIE